MTCGSRTLQGVAPVHPDRTGPEVLAQGEAHRAPRPHLQQHHAERERPHHNHRLRPGQAQGEQLQPDALGGRHHVLLVSRDRQERAVQRAGGRVGARLRPLRDVLPGAALLHRQHARARHQDHAGRLRPGAARRRLLVAAPAGRGAAVSGGGPGRAARHCGRGGPRRREDPDVYGRGAPQVQRAGEEAGEGEEQVL